MKIQTSDLFKYCLYPSSPLNLGLPTKCKIYFLTRNFISSLFSSVFSFFYFFGFILSGFPFADALLSIIWYIKLVHWWILNLFYFGFWSWNLYLAIFSGVLCNFLISSSLLKILTLALFFKTLFCKAIGLVHSSMVQLLCILFVYFGIFSPCCHWIFSPMPVWYHRPHIHVSS